jgi:hypothetical protein
MVEWTGRREPVGYEGGARRGEYEMSNWSWTDHLVLIGAVLVAIWVLWLLA